MLVLGLKLASAGVSPAAIGAVGAVAGHPCREVRTLPTPDRWPASPSLEPAGILEA
jgi:hypothetical protein